MRAYRLSLIALLLSILPSTHPSAETLGDARVGFTAERVLILDGLRFVGPMWHMPSEQRHEQDFPAMHLILILRRVVRAPGAAINSEPLERIEFRHSRISTRDLGARALALFFHRDAHPEAASDSLAGLSRSTLLRQSRASQQPCPQRDFGDTLIGSTSRLAKRGRNRIVEFGKLELTGSIPERRS